MTHPIRGLAFDAFKTTILEAYHFESPYKALITVAFPKSRGQIMAQLRHDILTQPIPLKHVVSHAIALGGIPSSEAAEGLLYAQQLLDNQLREKSFERNPELDDVLHITDEHGIQTGVISDLACPYGVIVKHHLYDLEHHVYSYREQSIKTEEEPFVIMADKMGVKVEELAYVGNDYKSDYLTPKNMGINAFWYIPDQAVYLDANPNSGKLLRECADDIVSTLPEVFTKLQQRHLTLG